MPRKPKPKSSPRKDIMLLPLTPRQRAFALHYLQHGNQARAAREAGYPPRANKYGGGDSGGIMASAQLRRFIEREQQRMFRRLRISTERVLAGLLAIAEADIGDMYDGHGRQLPPDKWPKELRRALAGVEKVPVHKKGKQTGLEYMPRFQDRVAAWKLLGTHLGMFTKKVEHSGPGGAPVQLQSAKAALMERILALREANDITTVTIEEQRALAPARRVEEGTPGAEDGASGTTEVPAGSSPADAGGGAGGTAEAGAAGRGGRVRGDDT